MSDPTPPVWPMYRALVLVGLVCGFAIVGVYQGTQPFIRANQLEAREKAVFAVLPGAVSATTFRAADGQFEPTASDATGNDLVFAGYDAAGALVGMAVEAQGMGYQDVIKLMYGLSLDQQAIIGIHVLESRETPGLGTRIETDPDFLRNFEALDVSLGEGGAVAHPIQPVKSGKKVDPWQIDCITGATISSTAVADMLQESSARWVPQLVARRSTFEGGH